MTIKIQIVIIALALFFNGFDIVTGIIKGFKQDGKLISSKLRDGLFKKIGFILCYILGIAISVAGQFIELPVASGLLPIICTYSILTEIVSIIENISVINPDLLTKTLKSLIGLKGDEV